jgi:hypothetical protein
MAFSRYSKLIVNGEIRSFPKVKISFRTTDIYINYNPNVTRLDRIAADAYGDDTLYWLILLANPQYYMEFDIPSGAVIRIPSPLSEAISEFNSKIYNSNTN